MSIQFPCDFAIPNLAEVKISDLVKSLSGSPLAMHRVKMPINRIAIFQVFVAEKIKLMAANFVGLTNNVLGLSRKPMTKQFQQRRDRGRCKEKLPRIDSCRVDQASREIKSSTRQQNVDTFGQFLTAAIDKFISIHGRQPGRRMPPAFIRHGEVRVQARAAPS